MPYPKSFQCLIGLLLITASSFKDKPMNNDNPQDKLVSHGQMHGWRLEVWKPALWLDTYDYRIRPVPRHGETADTKADFGGCGFQSVEQAKAAALADFKEKMRLGHLKPRL